MWLKLLLQIGWTTMWEFSAKFENGLVKTYTTNKNPMDRLEEIATIAFENNILLFIYHIRDDGTKIKVYDGLFNKILAEVANADISNMYA